MRILFLYPNKMMVTRVPLGIGYLSSYLKRDGHEVKVFDTTFIKCGNDENDDELREASLQVRNPDFVKYGLVEKDGDVNAEFESEIESFKPDLIAMSVVDPNYNFGLDLLRRVKAKYKNLTTIVGGATATFAPDEVISEDCVDMICVGEGEEAFSELCNKMDRNEEITNIQNIWVKQNGKVHKNGVRPLLDLNQLLLPDWDLFDQRHLIRPLGGKMYRMGIFSMTRGCVFRCQYCANIALSQRYKNKGTYYRIKNPDLLIEEIASYKEKYNLEFVFFTDDLFPLHKREILDDFCRLYKERVGLPFNVSLHPDLVKEEHFAKLVDAGCRNICVGLESGNPKIRKELLGRSYKNDQIVHVFGLARKYKVRSSSFNMIGIPYETRKDIFETIELNRKANPTTTTLTFLHPYRGTAFRDLCIQEKFFDPSKEREYENVYRTESHLNLPQISRKTLRGLFQTFQLYLKLPKKYYGLIRIAEGESFFAKYTFNKLTKIFYRTTENESEWDFSKMTQDSKAPREIHHQELSDSQYKGQTTNV